MPTSCLVAFCKNRGKISGIHYFSLTASRRQSWLRAVGRHSDDEISSHAVICSDHFTHEDFLESGRLKDDVIPSLKLRPEKPSFRISLDTRFNKSPSTTTNGAPEGKSCVPFRTTTTLNIVQPSPNAPTPTNSSQDQTVTHTVTKKIDANEATIEVQTDIPLPVPPIQQMNICTNEPINPVCIKLSEILTQLPVRERSQLEIEFLTKAYKVLNGVENISTSFDSSLPPLSRLHQRKEELNKSTTPNRSKTWNAPSRLDPTSDDEDCRTFSEAQTYVKTFHNYCVPPKE